jgi:hypothetical protein
MEKLTQTKNVIIKTVFIFTKTTQKTHPLLEDIRSAQVCRIGVGWRNERVKVISWILQRRLQS